MRHAIAPVLLGAAFMLAACGASDQPPAAPVPPETPARAPAPASAPAPKPAGGAGTATPAAAPVDATHLIALSPDGLDIVDANTGSIRHLAFGQPADQVIEAVTRVRKVEPQLATNTDCTPGAMDFATLPEGLTVLSQDGTFVGWSVNPRTTPAPQPLTTVAGIGLGSTRSELEAAYAISTEESIAGLEFRAGGLRGLLQSAQPDARITALRGGATCGFR